MSRLPIEFHRIPYVNHAPTSDEPAPFPAAQGLPQRLKRIPSELSIEEDQTLVTVKKCPPFVDAMTSGYFIPIIADVQFHMKAQGLEYSASLPIIENHDPRQLIGSSLQRMVIIKFLNPWIVRTPPGYSCLFTSALNRFEIPFQPLSGVVETDRLYHEINFPAICLLATGQSVMVKKGTPLVQVIPFKRDDWEAHRDAADMVEREEWEHKGEREGRYKANYWQRKSYE